MGHFVTLIMPYCLFLVHGEGGGMSGRVYILTLSSKDND